MTQPTRTSMPATSSSKPRGAITNAGWNVFFTLWSIGISFLLTPLMVHYLGVQHYGTLLLVWSITGMLGIVNFGLGEVTLRYVAHYYGGGDLSGVNRVFGAILSFNVVMCGIVLVGMFWSAPAVVTWLNMPYDDYHLVTWLLRLAAVVFSLGLIYRAFSAIPMALMRYDVSSKINIGQSILRSAGYLLLVITKFGILYLMLWDAVTSFVALCVQLVVARKLLPGLKRMPPFSFKGLREIIGYSIFSFLTYGFLMVHRQSGKLALGTYIGPSAVAYLGTPDNVSERAFSLVVSGSETLLPRFGANRDIKTARSLFLNGTWVALVGSLLLFVPLVVLIPDFLGLWISPEFSSESSAVAQLVALSYITQGVFGPAATFFRGTGKPWFVSGVVFLAGIATLLFCILFIPSYGLLGAGYAYVLGSGAYFVGLVVGWLYVFGKNSVLSLLRTFGVPLLLATILFFIESAIHDSVIDVGWAELLSLAALFAVMTALPILGVDLIIGGDSPSKHLLERFRRSKQIEGLLRYVRGRSCS